MTTLTASEAPAGLYCLIDQAAESHKPVVISGKRANAVLVCRSLEIDSLRVLPSYAF